jgi:hypothetical protein
MESASSFGLQTAYGVHLPVTVGVSSGLQKQEDAPRNPAIGNADQLPSSTRVNISVAGQSRLAAEQQATPQIAATAASASAGVAQNVPFQLSQEAAPARNAPNYTADATTTQNDPTPLRQASVTLPTGAAPPVSAAPGITVAEPGVSTTGANRASVQINAPVSQATDNQPAAPRQEIAQQAQQREERQNVAAQSRQDDSPALAQSGITDNREVLSP